MTPLYAPAHITHNTHYIIAVDDAACLLFGQERRDLIDQLLVHGVQGDEMKWLAELRLRTIEKLGELPEQDLPFARLDGSVFWARCKTTKSGDGTYTTEMVYLYEY
jgi:hypothetical protein